MYAERVGLGRDFVIFDDDDQRTLVARVLKDLGIADRFATPRAMLSAIDGAKNRGEGPEAFDGHDYFSDLVARVYPVYQERLRAGQRRRLRRSAAQDAQAVRATPTSASASPSASTTCSSTSSRTPTASSTIWCNHLAARARNLCVVGDDDQSIYSWRGADVRNILDFERDHPGTHAVKLEQNYRSTQLILDAANGVIARNLERKQKRLFTEEGERRAHPLPHRRGRARARRSSWCAPSASWRSTTGASPADFAVFYRTHAQSRALEEALRAADLPYAVIGGIALLRSRRGQGSARLPARRSPTPPTRSRSSASSTSRRAASASRPTSASSRARAPRT